MTTPPILSRIDHYSGAARVEVYVYQQLVEVPLVFDQFGLVPPLPERPENPLTKIHSTRHFLLERLYGLMQRDRPGPYGQMEMIGKQTPREYRQPVPLDYIAERPGKPVHHDPAGCIGDIPRLLRRYDPTQASPLPLSD